MKTLVNRGDGGNDGLAIAIKMRRLFERLSEKSRRRYAGIEATKLEHGGTEYIVGLFGLDPNTVRRVLLQLDLEDDPKVGRVQKKSRGRKGAIER